MFSNRQARPYLLIFIVFSIIAVYFLIHILFWFYSTQQAEQIIEEVIEEEVETVEVIEEEEEHIYEELPFFSKDFTDLKERNNEIVAWLKIESVGVDIPITQTTDNEFYLTHDVNKEKNKLGWVFADTTCNIEHLGHNTILYGHNAMNRSMFGSLKDLLKSEDRDPDYDLIQFTTETKEMVFEIVSVYITEYDDWRYVEQHFAGDEDKRSFIDRMQEKNLMKEFAKSDLSVHDKFFTFSTCHGPAGTTKRLVVHSRLIGEKNVEPNSSQEG